MPRRRRPRKAPRPRIAKQIERAYTRAVVSYTREIRRVMQGDLRSFLSTLTEEQRQDADIDFGVIRARVELATQGRARRIVVQWLDALEFFNARDIARVLRVDPRELLNVDYEGIIQRNVELIQGLRPRIIEDVENTVRESIARGQRADVLARELNERFRVGESRAKLIARDQTLTTNSALARERMQQAGVERYEWSTSRDERVRPEHAALDGRVFTWSEVPDGFGPPGVAINCRCAAVPLLD